MHLVNKKKISFLLLLASLFNLLLNAVLLNYSYSESAGLPISGGYSTTASFVTHYTDGKFIFFFTDGIKGNEEKFLISIDGEDTLITLNSTKQIGIVETRNPSNILIYREKERSEISPQFKDNFKEYIKSDKGETYYFYRQVNNIYKELSDKEKSALVKLNGESVLSDNKKESNEKKAEAIGKLRLLTKEGILLEHIVYKSGLVNDDTQIKNTIEHIYNKQYGVVEIISLNNIPLSNSEYKNFAGSINRNNLGSSNEIMAEVNQNSMGSLNYVSTGGVGEKKEIINSSLIVNGLERNENIFMKSGTIMIPAHLFENLGINIIRKYRKDDLDLITVYDLNYKIEMRVSDNRTFINNTNKYDISPERVDGVIYLPSSLLHYFGYTINILDNKIAIEKGGYQ